MAKTIHEGRNVKRFREMLGIKQEGLAWQLGDDWNQQRISFLEQKEIIDPKLLEQISAALKIPVEAFQRFDEEQAINIISSSFDNGAFVNTGYNPVFNINPVDKWLEALDEIKRLNAELLKIRDEQVKMLHSLLEKK